MSEPGLTFGLPLLTKDLIEQAARPRTYILRIVYAAILYGTALWVYAGIGGGVDNWISNLGQGRELFVRLVQVQFAAIIVLLPAISCGAITAEKERDTLGLLLLTQLSPLTIILEKLLSRLVTMGTYQLLSLPLFAVVYGLGGVELIEIVAAIWFLAWWSAVVGAWSIFCSVWHRTTSGAFISAYAMMPVAVCFGSSCMTTIVPAFAGFSRSSGSLTMFESGVYLIGFAVALLAMAVPMVGVTVVLVAAARTQLLERAFVPPRNLLLELFQKLDAFFTELNERTTHGVLLVRDLDYGPMFEPIAWRETRKKSLGTVRYLFRLLVVLEVPLVIAISWTVLDTQSHSFDGPTSFFLSILWPIAAAAIVVHTTNVLASERSRQTLDVLLVAPLTPQDLISQKLAGVRRLIGVLTVPFATLLIFQAIWTLYVVRGLTMFSRGSLEGNAFLHEQIGMALAMIVYPRLVQWIAFHLALRLKNQTQAVLSSLAIVIGVCLIPSLVARLLVEIVSIPNQRIDYVAWLSPMRVLFHRRFTGSDAGWGASPNMYADEMYVGLAGHAVVFVAAWFVLRMTAINSFSRVVGRTEPTENSHESD